MEEDLIDAADAFEHLAFSHKAKSRLRNALDLEKMSSGEAVTFEVDAENLAGELALDEDEEELNVLGLDTESYTASYFSKKTENAVSKNAATIDALASTDFMSCAFADLEKSMISIHPDGLVKKEVVTPGTGKKVPSNGKIFIHYLAVCEGADEPFDSTILRRLPAIMDMRKCDGLAGFYIALESMELNEVSKFIVKSDLAFGKVGCPPRIPQDADILYIIEVLQIIDEEMLKSPLFLTADERALLPFQEIYSTAESLRTQGNGHFTNGSYFSAIKKYRKGATMLEDYPLASQKDEEKRNKLLHTIYSNLAQCYLNLDKPAKACTMCKLGLRSAKGHGDNVKLLYRFAKAKFLLKDYDHSINLCEQALRVEPNNQGVKDLRQQALVEDKKSSQKSKKMYQEMFK